MSRALRLGLVGLGKVAHERHLPAIAEDPRFALAATASPGAGLDDCPHFHDVEAMLGAGLDLDAVTICTPPQPRTRLARAAIDAGLHVMLEKPPATSALALAGLLRQAEARGTTLFAAWHARAAPAVASAASWLQRRQVQAVRVRWAEEIRRWHPGQEWILSEGGFGVFDPGINALSILTAILPATLRVDSATLVLPDGRATPIAATVQLRSGAAPVRAEFDFLHRGPEAWEIAVDTAQGALLLSHGGHALGIDGRTLEVRDESEYARLYSRFAALIDARQHEVDAEPLRLAERILRVGTRQTGAPFAF